jgi:hypothetical protein
MIRGFGRSIIRDGDRLDYWEGEHAEEPVVKSSSG